MEEKTKPTTIEIPTDKYSGESFPDSFFWDQRWLLHDHYHLNTPSHHAERAVQNVLIRIFHIFSFQKEWYSQYNKAPDQVVITPYFSLNKSVEQIIQEEANPNAIQATKDAIEWCDTPENEQVYREIISLQKNLTEERCREIIRSFLDEFAEEIADKLKQDKESISLKSLEEIVFLFIRPLQQLFSPIIEKMDLERESAFTIKRKIEVAKKWQKDDMPEKIRQEERSLEELQKALEERRAEEKELRLKWLGRNSPEDVN